MGKSAIILTDEVSESKATTGDGGDPPMSKGEIRRFKKLCREIKSDLQLAAILNQVSFDRREAIYRQFLPWLPFKAKPFDELRFY